MQHVATSITYKFPLRFLRKFNDVRVTILLT